MSALAPLNDDYLRLIRLFPLCRIHNDEELDAASEVYSRLAVREESLTPGEHDYLETLSCLIDSYEQVSPGLAAYRDRLKKLTAREILQSFMSDHHLSQSELARSIGYRQSAISEYLSGKRSLSKMVARKLAQRFKVSVELFLDSP